MTCRSGWLGGGDFRSRAVVPKMVAYLLSTHHVAGTTHHVAGTVPSHLTASVAIKYAKQGCALVIDVQIQKVCIFLQGERTKEAAAVQIDQPAQIEARSILIIHPNHASSLVV